MYAFAFNFLRASSIRFILWSHSRCSGSFSNFFLLNKWVNGRKYSGKFSEFVLFCSFLILPLSCSLISIIWVLLVLNSISWCFILQLLGHLVNFIIPFFQLTSELYLTIQSWSKNMSILFKSVITAPSCSLCLFISISRGAILVTSPFFVLSALKTSNESLLALLYPFFLDQLFINSHMSAFRIH